MAKKWGERQAEVLNLVSRVTNGVTPKELMEEFGLTSEVVAAVYLSRWKRQGLLLKRKERNGCRYCLSTKGERKLAYLQTVEEEGG